jgi:AcrR family transcriptional regulator
MPKPEKREAKRAAILEAGKRAFQKWGLDKTTMEDIAREVGKGKSTLYYYYRTKEEIFDGLLRTEMGALLSRAKASVQGVSSARERLRRYIVGVISELNNALPLYEIVREEIAERPTFLKKMMEQFEPGELRYLQEVLALGVQQNQFGFANDREQEAMAGAILRIVQAVELDLFVAGHDSDYLQRAARIISGGI